MIEYILKIRAKLEIAKAAALKAAMARSNQARVLILNTKDRILAVKLTQEMDENDGKDEDKEGQYLEDNDAEYAKKET